MSTTTSLGPSWEPTECFTQVANEFIRCPRISNAAKVVGICIMSHKPSYPSYTKLCQYTGMCRDTVSNAIHELVQWRIIEYIKGNSYRRSNRYRIRPPNDWRTNDLEFRPVEKPNRSKKKTAGEPPGVVAEPDSYQSENQTTRSSVIQPVSVDFSDPRNTPENTNRKRSIENSNGVARPAARGPRLHQMYESDPRIIAMKSYLTDDYLQDWFQREYKQPGLLWFCNRLIDIYEFFQAHPDHVQDFHRSEFIIREIKSVQGYKAGVARVKLRERFEKYVGKKAAISNSQLISSGPEGGLGQETGKWKERSYDF